MNRYPGPRPFSGDDRHLFFGRGLEQQELLRLIVLNDIVVLFGESGTGKTSLLQAGVCPGLEARQYKPVFIRLNNTAEAPELQVCRQLKEGGFIPADMPEDRTLWEYFNRFWYVDLGDVFTPVFVFDQFEELFTLYQPDERRAFVEQFAAVASGRPPAGLPADVAAPPRAKFVFSIRSDFLYLLDELSADIPAILRCRFQLRLLGREHATEAITKPPGVEGNYASPKFSYSPAALSGILEALGRHEAEGRLVADHPGATLEIAAFQLQLVCQHLEGRIIREGKPEGFVIEPGFYGGAEGIRKIIDEFYNTVIEKVPPAEREAAERLLARGLIRNGRLIMMEESVMREENGLSQSTLALLHEERLLKREARKGELYYELSHDTLVKPVLKRFKKIEEAERERKALEEEERLRKEREEIRRARLRNMVIGIAALALLGFAFWQMYRAQQAGEKAKIEQRNAEEAKKESKEAGEETLRQQRNAELEKQNALTAQEKAELAELKAKSEQAKAARAEKEVIEKSRTLVLKFIEEANKEIYWLQYEEALSKLRKASGFGLEKPAIARVFVEAAFWYGESGSIQPAAGLLDSAAQLVKNTAVPVLLKSLPKDTAAARQRIRDAIQLFDKGAYDTLWARHYPDVTGQVEGDTFNMGSREEYGANQLPAAVSNFQISKYETTWWQYALFCRATGKDYENPGWGTDGDNPAVNVSWYDAVEYANWLSKRMGYKEAMVKNRDGNYTINLKADGFRLPTEAEWEFAARGGIHKSPFTYAGSDDIDEVAWHYRNSGSRTRPVGKLKKNALNLHDMSGNVYEWCWDWYRGYPKNAPLDYTGLPTGSVRVLRGGAWLSGPDGARCSYRDGSYPENRFYSFGFRLARSGG